MISLLISSKATENVCLVDAKVQIDKIARPSNDDNNNFI